MRVISIYTSIFSSSLCDFRYLYITFYYRNINWGLYRLKIALKIKQSLGYKLKTPFFNRLLIFILTQIFLFNINT